MGCFFELALGLIGEFVVNGVIELAGAFLGWAVVQVALCWRIALPTLALVGLLIWLGYSARSAIAADRPREERRSERRASIQPGARRSPYVAYL